MRHFYLAFALVVAVCTLLPEQSSADCWETDVCHLDSWEVKGCAQYSRKETNRRPCDGGFYYTCCTNDQPAEPSTGGSDCWETDVCQLDSWRVKGCAQYGRQEVARRPCDGGFFYTCCLGNTAGGGSSGNHDGNGTKRGDMTYYYPSKGACGWTHNENEMIVAISGKLFTSSNPNLDPICGKKIKITDPQSNKTIICTVVDMCPECAIGDVDVTPTAFQMLRPMVVGRFKIEWEWV